MFIDRVKIRVKAGRGGNGCVSFRREKYVPRGGPDGGDGGKGGDIIVRVDPHMRTLLDLRYRKSYNAEPGRHGQGKRMTGRSGKSTVINVPPGTVIKDVATGEVIADLTAAGEEFVVARGGKGGKGNYTFRSPTNQAPKEATPGEPGEEKELEFTLKLIADVGLVGLPNAGKSTLLRSLSDAHPVVAEYPFSTLEPVLGMVRVEVGESFCMVDIPGLIEGAHAGRGLGIKFLQHVERCKVLIFIIDLAAEIRPVKAFSALVKELELYDRNLAAKPRLVALNKIDAVDKSVVDEALSEFASSYPDEETFTISAMARIGVGELALRAYDALKRFEKESDEEQALE